MSGAVGVAIAAASVEAFRYGLSGGELVARDMTLTFGVVALVTLGSVPIFLRLKPDAGAQASGQRLVAETTAPGAATSS